MFLPVHHLRIIGLLLLAVIILSLFLTIFFFTHTQTAHPDGSVDYHLRTVTYCSPDHLSQLMDIYIPALSMDNAPMPLVEMVHGGGWTSGSKGTINTIQPVSEVSTTLLELLAHGFIVTSINYRLAPQFKFPAAIEDVKCSIRYLRTHAAQYHIDASRIGLMGSSAGGHLVSLAGLAGRNAGWDVGEYLNQSSAVQAVVDMFGPEYIASGIGNAAIGNSAIFGSNPQMLYRASPPFHISKTPGMNPPFFILQGSEDVTVPPFHSLRFYRQLREAGQPAILQLVKNAGHEFEPVPASSAIIPSANQISNMMVQFFMKYLRR